MGPAASARGLKIQAGPLFPYILRLPKLGISAAPPQPGLGPVKLWC